MKSYEAELITVQVRKVTAINYESIPLHHLPEPPLLVRGEETALIADQDLKAEVEHVPILNLNRAFTQLDGSTKTERRYIAYPAAIDDVLGVPLNFLTKENQRLHKDMEGLQFSLARRDMRVQQLQDRIYMFLQTPWYKRIWRALWGDI